MTQGADKPRYVNPAELPAGTVIRHRPSGARLQLRIRKLDVAGTRPGWWMTDGSGLVDDAWDGGEWEVDTPVDLPTARARNALAELREAMDVIRPPTPRFPDGNGPSLEQMMRLGFDLVEHILTQVDTLLGSDDRFERALYDHDLPAIPAEPRIWPL